MAKTIGVQVTTEELSIATPEPAASPEPETTQIEGEEVKAEGEEGDESKETPVKAEKTPEERERQRMQRGIDRRTKQLAEARAEADYLRQQLTRGQKGVSSQPDADDSEPLSLTRAQINEMVKAEAEKLAPTLREQAQEVERRQGVVQSLAKTWGQDKFDELSSDLDEAFGGLTDRSGSAKPAIEAVFEADNPAKVIEYLADPDNLDEAEAIAKMGAVSTQDQKPKTKVSKAPAPLEAVRGQGKISASPDPSNTKEWIQWRNEQERKGL
jgi:hypothetical protein